MNRYTLAFSAMLGLAACASLPNQANGDDLKAELSEKVHWLSGCWQHVEGPTREVWDMAAPDLLFGYSVTISGDRLRAFEDLRIEPSSEGLVYVASPNGSSPTRFIETESTDDSLTFENPDHDFPQRIEYGLTDIGVTAVISTLDRSQSFDIPMRACD